MRALLPLVVSCWSASPEQPRAIDVAPSPRTVGAICDRPAGTERLLMPDPRPTTKLRIEVHAPGGVVPERWKGQMMIDGTVTASQWPEQAPVAYPLRDGRTLLYDAYNANLVYLWDPQRRALTELGRYGLVRAGDLGILVASYGDDGVLSYLDVDPDRTRPRLRTVWTPRAQTAVLGTLDGELALYSRRGDHTVAITCLFGPKVAHEARYPLAAQLRPVDSDAVRGHRVLMFGPNVPPTPAPGRASALEPPFATSIWILDLDTGAPRQVGVAQGQYTRYTAIPHGYVRVQWKAPQPPGAGGPQLLWSGDEITTFVDPATERVW